MPALFAAHCKAPPSSEIIIYTAPDGNTDIQVKLDGDTIWLSQRQMSELFEKGTDTIGLHLKNIFSSVNSLESKEFTGEESKGLLNIRACSFWTFGK
ncbi:MAG: hypothetical protein DRI97_03310 [Bacteroidetes bacterium]|nr:MAG: hypothetical protein DRI97_03310 [Bacteroidota bacterium]RLD72325.1 MAG: hypothetical protein DRI98_02460 [Bacteroidota bacterium]RLD94836.1 MAG: hypothetical protein DRJ29_04700 [Bacteroidota bacterium]RLE00462.1 MAG: hypothetical protein DRJ13_08485 [Bacteroidota bacterium]